MSKFDIIGDIHGHADELLQLLCKLDYRLDHEKNTHVHSDSRRVIFVGDLIDRGPKIREVLQIVRSMVESGNAICIMGNHEYNALNFWEKIRCKGGEFGGYYREHSHKNLLQHFRTIQAFQNREDEWYDYLEWFRTLPICLDLGDLRVVHATWDPEYIEMEKELLYREEKSLRSRMFSLTHMMMSEARCEMVEEDGLLVNTKFGGRVNELLERVLKGDEIDLPEGCQFSDKDGNVRERARTNWWLDPIRKTFASFLEPYAAKASPRLEEVAAPSSNPLFYPADEKPVFFGHYWLRGEPKLQALNVCCLDYSVAKGGSLIAYRFDGERELDDSKFVTVP